jgi:two-component system chemotaxis sensor kinase CheA
VGFFSDEQSGELRELFFESASELLQALNEEGLRLERRPGDAEVVREVRRTVHTLKGDAAACGFQELSSLAHELEDALTLELAQSAGPRLAEVVLAAADAFAAMLEAFRNQTAVPAGEAIREAVRGLVTKPPDPGAPGTPDAFRPRFQWTEYEQNVIADAVGRGLKVHQVSLDIDPDCLVKGAALQMVRNALAETGKVLFQNPEEASEGSDLTRIEAVLASSFDGETIARKCKIPAVIANAVVQPAKTAAPFLAPPVMTPGTEAAGGEGTSLPDLAAVGATNILRVDAERVDLVLNLVGELVIAKSMLTQTMAEFDLRFSKDPIRAKFADALAFQARILNDLQKSVMKIRMVPVEQLFRRFPRMVRDVAKACGKEVDLVITGQETDLDKSILDLLYEPMSHMVRNAISHGIETADERRAAGKPEHGSIRLNAYHQGNEVVIEIEDDGAGLNRDKILQKAVEGGLVATEEASRLNDSEIYGLIFHPGFSTAEEVTSVAGRGVGMDVVRNVLESLKGTVTLDTRPDRGTKFFLKLPLTLAIIKALMFRAGEKLYAIPLGAVVEITRARESEVHTVDRRQVIQLREEVLPLIRLNRLARAPMERTHKIFIVVVSVEGRKYGLVVDRLVGEEELVIKALDDELVATDYVSGASILGDGTVVLILNINSVVGRLGRVEALEATA